MFMKELMISGLRKQHALLDELMEHLQRKHKLDGVDCYLYRETTDRVAKNIRQLRKIKSQYVSYLESMTFPD